MQSQETLPEVIEQETRKVKEIASLSEADKVTFNDSGWDSRVYTINDGEYFVKFPRSEKIRLRFGYQIAALQLANSIDSKVTVPKVIWKDVNNNYFGYAGIEGVALTKARADLDDAAKEQIGTALGDFLRQFHQLQLPEARAMGIDHEIKQVQDWYEKGLHLSSSVFTEDEQKKLHMLVYDEWPARLTALGGNPVLCHGDFHFDNIFYGSDVGVGVIDFGDVCNADHSKDFADFGDLVIFEATLKAYGSKDEKLREKIRLREDMTRIITLTAQLIKPGEQSAQETITKIKESF